MTFIGNHFRPYIFVLHMYQLYCLFRKKKMEDLDCHLNDWLTTMDNDWLMVKIVYPFDQSEPLPLSPLIHLKILFLLEGGSLFCSVFFFVKDRYITGAYVVQKNITLIDYLTSLFIRYCTMCTNVHKCAKCL